MKLDLKDEPKQWRKSALLAAFGLLLISSLLRWRHILANQSWLPIVAVLAAIILAAILRPHWFRRYHLLSMRLGFAISHTMGQVLLLLLFFFVITPMGYALRLAGKDPLQLKPSPGATTFWQTAKPASPLDRLF